MHKWGNGERLLLATCVGLSLPDIAAKEQWPVKGQKETSRTYCKHSRLLTVSGQYRKRCGAKSSKALSLTLTLSRTCYACSRSRSLFLHYRIQPHLLSPLIIVRLKMTYLEIFQSNIVKYTTNRYVDYNAVSWFLLRS